MSSTCMVVSKETKSLKCFTIDYTDQSHVNKIKYCLEEKHFEFSHFLTLNFLTKFFKDISLNKIFHFWIQ